MWRKNALGRGKGKCTALNQNYASLHETARVRWRTACELRRAIITTCDSWGFARFLKHYDR